VCVAGHVQRALSVTQRVSSRHPASLLTSPSEPLNITQPSLSHRSGFCQAAGAAADDAAEAAAAAAGGALLVLLRSHGAASAFVRGLCAVLAAVGAEAADVQGAAP
jgi:hypothetical protein